MQNRFRVLETRTAFGVFPDRQSAGRVIGVLLDGGFDDEHISVVVADRSGAAADGNQSICESDSFGQYRLQRISGDGEFLAAGPMVSRMSGPAFAADMGVLAGAIVGAGIPPAAAEEIESQVLRGKVVVAYICRNDAECDQVPELFRGNAAEWTAFTPAEGYPSEAATGNQS
jgi:hypothetical protein